MTLKRFLFSLFGCRYLSLVLLRRSTRAEKGVPKPCFWPSGPGDDENGYPFRKGFSPSATSFSCSLRISSSSLISSGRRVFRGQLGNFGFDYFAEGKDIDQIILLVKERRSQRAAPGLLHWKRSHKSHCPDADPPASSFPGTKWPPARWLGIL